MILHNRSGTGRACWEKVFTWALIALIIGAVALTLVRYQRPAGALPPGETIVCDAERASGSSFRTGPFECGRGELQSREQAHSGVHACKVPAGEGAQYGFNFLLKDVQPGQAYKAVVWRFKSPQREGKLAVSSKGTHPFYFEESRPAHTEESGWEKLEIPFYIPFGAGTGEVNIYVYTNGFEPVFFDDLALVRLGQWSEDSFQPEVLELDIPDRAMAKLEQKRAEAIRRGILVTENGDWVDGLIRRTNGGDIPVRVRLKGDWLDHLGGDKWSFRVKVRDPFQWRRMTVFSLHTPAARYFLHEWLLHRLWEKEDVLTTRYDFVELRLNGRSLGIYAFEEHFEKQLVEYRRRREGPILKFSEEGLWAGMERQLSNQGFLVPGAPYSAADPDNADIDTFQGEEAGIDTALAAQYAMAGRLLDEFREGTARPSDVFDLERTARYYAACDVLNGYHGIIWHNQRFYFNPVTGRLEPIGFDGYGGPPDKAYTFLGEGALHPQSLISNTLFSRLFQDSTFTRHYLAELYRLSSDAYMQGFLDSLYADWAPRLRWLQMEFPDYRPSWGTISDHARFVHSLVLPFPGQSVKAYAIGGGNSRQVCVRNTHTLPVQVIAYGSRASQPEGSLSAPVILPGQPPREYLRRLQRDSLLRDFGSLRFLEEGAVDRQAAPHFDTLNLPGNARFLFFRPLGLDTVFQARIQPAPVREQALIPQDLLRKPPLRDTALYLVEGRNIRFRPGIHRIRKDLVLPEGYIVHFPAGLQLDLLQGARFLSRSPVMMYGEEEAPILITSSDDSGGGFTVLQAPVASVLKNVIFERLNTFRSGGWLLTGAVTFYESAVSFYRCVFRDNHCEDALNTIRCTFSMKECRFSNTFGDAFDSDFCTGEIRASAFVDTRNDGLDLSGSVVNVYQCRFRNNGDKGVSVGEESDVHLFDASFDTAPIAMASKDLSLLFVRNATIRNCDTGFAAFQKKPEYGGGTIIVESYQAEQVRRLQAIAEGSFLQMGQPSGQ